MSDFISLSLDLGSTFGWAIGKNGVITKSGEVALTSPSAHPGHRLLKWQEWLTNHKDVNEILFEDVPGFQSGAAAKVHGALLGLLQVFCLIHGIRMCCLKPQQIKMDFTGKKMAKKEEMCEVALNLGWKHGRRGTRDNNNECDAIALLWSIYKRRLIEPAFASGV